jgi:nitroreductase
LKIVDEIVNLRTPQAKLPIVKCINKRFSPRIFSKEPIPQNDLEIIFEAARFAPSARFNQPWFYYYVRKGTVEYEKLFECVPERNYWAKTAPVIIIACYDPTEPVDGKNKWAQYDLGASVATLVLQATELGYYCRQIGSFDSGKTKTEFAILDPLQVFTLIVVGKMGNEEDYEKADPEIVKKDLTPYPRKDKIYQKLPV